MSHNNYLPVSEERISKAINHLEKDSDIDELSKRSKESSTNIRKKIN